MRFKPVIISHHMLMGLKEGQEKMSKSDPDSAIFMEDAAEDVKRKVSCTVALSLPLKSEQGLLFIFIAETCRLNHYHSFTLSFSLLSLHHGDSLTR